MKDQEASTSSSPPVAAITRAARPPRPARFKKIPVWQWHPLKYRRFRVGATKRMVDASSSARAARGAGDVTTAVAAAPKESEQEDGKEHICGGWKRRTNVKHRLQQWLGDAITIGAIVNYSVGGATTVTLSEEKFTQCDLYNCTYTGHGGSCAAEYLKEHLFENLLKHPAFISDTKTSISESYTKTDSDFLDAETNIHREDGSTALTAILVGNHLYVANVGDSRAVILKAGKAIALSDDHKPDKSDERERIENVGGVVTFSGTWREQEIDDELEYLILASDGLWDVVSNECEPLSGRSHANQFGLSLIFYQLIYMSFHDLQFVGLCKVTIYYSLHVTRNDFLAHISFDLAFKSVVRCQIQELQEGITPSPHHRGVLSETSKMSIFIVDTSTKQWKLEHHHGDPAFNKIAIVGWCADDSSGFQFQSHAPARAQHVYHHLLLAIFRGAHINIIALRPFGRRTRASSSGGGTTEQIVVAQTENKMEPRSDGDTSSSSASARVRLLDREVATAKQTENKMLESLISQTKELEQAKMALEEARLEAAALRLGGWPRARARVARVASAENSKLRDAVAEKEDAMGSLRLENESLKASEAAAQGRATDLHNQLTAASKTAAAAGGGEKASGLLLEEWKTDAQGKLSAAAFLDSGRVMAAGSRRDRRMSPSISTLAELRSAAAAAAMDDYYEFDHFDDGRQYGGLEHAMKHKKRRSVLRKFGDLFRRRSLLHKSDDFAPVLASR
uniref:protein-serine/threonine phosphatase n=1 Tax=Aegilops tauschii TaxID=37682 RepID=M8C554_AEGTA